MLRVHSNIPVAAQLVVCERLSLSVRFTYGKLLHWPHAANAALPRAFV